MPGPQWKHQMQMKYPNALALAWLWTWNCSMRPYRNQHFRDLETLFPPAWWTVNLAKIGPGAPGAEAAAVSTGWSWRSCSGLGETCQPAVSKPYRKEIKPVPGHLGISFAFGAFTVALACQKLLLLRCYLRPSGRYQPYGKFQPRCPCKYQTGSSFQVVQVFNAIRG